ncbi:MAG: hypothetical protein Q4P15_00915 [Propionibacteriaceae bacterium]|nr:hypothetical protein [Propionibacteriaceae bacterium]
MRLHTPVVISNDEAVLAVAQARGWKILRHDGTDIWFPTGSAVTPEPAMHLQGFSARLPFVNGWTDVLRFIASQAHNPLLIVEVHHPLSEFALWAQRVHGWPHGVLIADRLPVLGVDELARVSTAEGFFFPKELQRSDVENTWPGLVLELPSTPLLPVVRHEQPGVARRKTGVTRVLLVAYFAGRFRGVGAQRPNYWFEEMERLSGGAVSVDIAVGVPWPDAPERVHHVPDLGSASVVTGQPLEQWAITAQQLSAANALSHTQVGVFWAAALEEYFEARHDHYDVVIITGNPFGYFEFARYAKRRWYAATILDYRDPLTMNPRVDFTPTAKNVARHVEIGWNHMADAVTSVNERCAEWVQGDPDLRVEVIRNGFDERVGLPEILPRKEGPIRFVHAGQFYVVSPPDGLIKAIAECEAEFHQVGGVLAQHSGAVTNHGMVSRSDVVELLATMDCGVTFSSETGFETPTKVFDYLAAGLDVMVLYRGNPETSALASMLVGVEGVHWVEDSTEAITAFLSLYRNPTRHDDATRRLRFARKTSTLQLVDLVKELGDHSFQLPLHDSEPE